MSTIAEEIVILTTRLALYYAAEAAVLGGQAYSIGNRSLTRADLQEIKKCIIDLRTEKLQLERGNKGIILQRVVPRDI